MISFKSLKNGSNVSQNQRSHRSCNSVHNKFIIKKSEEEDKMCPGWTEEPTFLQHPLYQTVSFTTESE